MARKDGLIERAAGGTLFLDEIAELPDAVQAKLLRLLESGVYFRLGETRERCVNFRLIAATHKDLTDPGNGFRSDLYFRINGMSFELPPLRERVQDIPALVRLFLAEANRDYLRQVDEVASEAMAALQAYHWPGNIRELKWVVHRAVAVSAGRALSLEDLATSPEVFRPRLPGPGEPSRPETAEPAFSSDILALERQRILHAIEMTAGNKTRAAAVLGISVRTLHYKLKKHGL